MFGPGDLAARSILGSRPPERAHRTRLRTLGLREDALGSFVACRAMHVPGRRRGQLCINILHNPSAARQRGNGFEDRFIYHKHGRNLELAPERVEVVRDIDDRLRDGGVRLRDRYHTQ